MENKTLPSSVDRLYDLRHVSNEALLLTQEQQLESSLFHPPERTFNLKGSRRKETGTSPSHVLTPPLQLETKNGDRRESEKQKSVLQRVLDLFRSIRPGSDLTKFQVPAQFNIPKSQLQLYGETVYCCAEDLLSRCAEAKTPIERLLNVVAWHISTTRLVPFAVAPLNPILGETHHVSRGDLNVLLEQVSHHPPITALYATNDKKKIEMLWWHSASSRFYGSSVEATIHGRRTLILSEHKECYEMACPKLCFRFFPVPGTEWAGSTTIKCSQSCLEATVSFKNKSLLGLRGAPNQISGKICNTSTGQVLYELNGHWNRIVTLKDLKTGRTSTLYDAQAVLSNLTTPVLANPHGLAPTESVVVWSKLMEAILVKDWDKARDAKQEVEERQRASRKQRERTGSLWSPKYFTSTRDGEWEWLHQGHYVHRGPIIVEKGSIREDEEKLVLEE